MAAQAATVTDATLDIAALKNGTYGFSGDFTDDLVNGPKKKRLYDLDITVSFRGRSVPSDRITGASLSDGPFSVKDLLGGDIHASGLGKLIAGPYLDSGILSKSR